MKRSDVTSILLNLIPNKILGSSLVKLLFGIVIGANNVETLIKTLPMFRRVITDQNHPEWSGRVEYVIQDSNRIIVTKLVNSRIPNLRIRILLADVELLTVISLQFSPILMIVARSHRKLLKWVGLPIVWRTPNIEMTTFGLPRKSDRKKRKSPIRSHLNLSK